MSDLFGVQDMKRNIAMVRTCAKKMYRWHIEEVRDWPWRAWGNGKVGLRSLGRGVYIEYDTTSIY